MPGKFRKTGGSVGPLCRRTECEIRLFYHRERLDSTLTMVILLGKG